MNSENLRLFICYRIYNIIHHKMSTSLSERFKQMQLLFGRKNYDTTRKFGKHSQPKNQNCIKMPTESQVHLKNINLMKPHLAQIG